MNPAAAAPNVGESLDIAFYYQQDVPADLLKAFDIVVLDPTRAKPVVDIHTPADIWYARLGSDTLNRIATDPQAWFGQQFSLLKQQGYVGFLLDDGLGYDQEDAASKTVLERVFAAFRDHAQDEPLVLRNHLDLARIHASRLRAVVIDGIYQRGPVRSGILVEIPATEHEDMLRRARQLQVETGLAVVGLDYCLAPDLLCRRDHATRILEDGLIPYVSDPALSVVGIGALEVLPRAVLMVVDRPPRQALDETDGARLYTMPLNQLGYAVEYADVAHLPVGASCDRYAGIVVALSKPPRSSTVWRNWMLQRIREGMPVAVFGEFGFEIGALQARALDLRLVPAVQDFRLQPRIVHEDPMIGFEGRPFVHIQSLNNFQVGEQGRALLTVEAGNQRYDMVGLTPWGGFALSGYAVTSVNSFEAEHWALQPIDFLRQTLRLPAMPIPVVTTENGLRLLFVHVDGDGSASRAEMPGAPLSPQVLMNQILMRYPIPHTISVVEGEVGPNGIYPQDSPAVEPIVRKIFAMPQVELGSHTFSHPFLWQEIEDRRLGITDTNPADEHQAFNLPIPGYEFDLKREIQGSIDYIETRLASPGKRVEIFLWTGDAAPSAYALEEVHRAGVLNINGGDTTITKTAPSWTQIAPLGLAKGPGDANFHVYAGIMNENVYTNDWLGPFYGYRRVLETFDLTGAPLRFKPINIYYHFYAATKQASLKALRQVYDAALSKPVLPIYTSEYARKVLDWVHVAIARKGDQWVIRSGQDLRELLWTGPGVPEIAGSVGVSGYNRGPDGIYVHLGGDSARFRIAGKPSTDMPYISEAAGRVRHFSRKGRSLRFEFGGYYRPYVALKSAKGCKVLIDGQARAVAATYSVSGGPAKPTRFHQFEVQCD